MHHLVYVCMELYFPRVAVPDTRRGRFFGAVSVYTFHRCNVSGASAVLRLEGRAPCSICSQVKPLVYFRLVVFFINILPRLPMGFFRFAIRCGIWGGPYVFVANLVRKHRWFADSFAGLVASISKKLILPSGEEEGCYLLLV